ncbi:Similar to DNA mismatch repair protein msh3; acc. no. Q5B6T1 [Pyronema omphalodes CBS 100304]|uniref:DNA mismatch repair protein n=1 Tax=Pyronema omphalodes (strain CBS 100304) TaxID=1076935 RepID=U4KYZ7_PYROM|nr:Similar to DNA mismatch repair protein msh3; acc. no. Q5B6T1 [Pyronema omphalodes CBS 100304]
MPPPSSQPTKQRTISSFFAPKSSPASIPKDPASTPSSSAAPIEASKPTAKPTAKPAPKSSQQKRTIRAPKKKKNPTPEPEDAAEDDDDDDDDDDVVTSTRRRASKRAAPDSEDEYNHSADDDNDDRYTAPNKGKKPVKKARKNIHDDDDEELDDAPRAPRAPGATQSGVSESQGSYQGSYQGSQATASRFRYDPTQRMADKMEVDAPQEDPERTQKKQELREKFMQKLGKIEFARPSSSAIGDDSFGELGDGEDGQAAELAPAEEEPVPSAIVKKFGRGKAATDTKATKATTMKGKKGPKLTPLEQQVVNIKQKYPDTILVVEVGYKFRFFGEDARVASQNLSIMCIPGKMRFDNHPSESQYERFASASIPVHRLHVHVKRLVANGYKVGIVRQLETAALKAAGDNKSAPFERRLTNLYTKGTYIDDIDGMGMEGDMSAGAGSGGASNTGFLLAVTEKPGGGTGSYEKVSVGIVAVQPSTGELVYDEFSDGFMRSEIETRLLHIAPCEFLIVGELTKASEKIVQALAGSTTNVFGDRVRVERVEKVKKEADAAIHVNRFYADKVTNAEDPEGKNKLLDKVMGLPPLVTTCLSAMITHLTDYGLEHVFDLTKYFQSFSGRSHMLLNGNTLSSLEIYRNQTDFSTKGSLFWTLDRTKTKFGRRLLRNWVGRPLLDRHQLEQRVEAVEEMAHGDNPKLEKLKELISKITYDLEKGLIRIYYGKCTRPELLAILQTMLRIANCFPAVESPSEAGFKSNMINTSIAALPGMKTAVQSFLDEFSHQAAGKDDKYNFFLHEDNDEYEAIVGHKCGITAVEADLDAHRAEISSILKGRKVSYVTVSGIEYLIELPNDKNTLKNVPASWVKISGTKKVDRYHTPEIINMLRERDQHKESLAAECDKAFIRFLARISTHYQDLRDTVASLATLDCLLSLATVANQPGYSKPVFVDETIISVTAGRHPMVEQLLLSSYVPNDISLSPSSPALLITGPNMGGKSSFVRQVALISIMAQIGSYVPCDSAKLGLLDAVFTRMGANDNMMAGESTFMVELNETSEILKQATNKSLVILDELGRGTSTHDGVAIANAVLEFMLKDSKALTLFVTHYPLLAKMADIHQGIRNVHMGFEELGEDEIAFLYKLAEGVAHRSYGLNVARMAGLPQQLLENAGKRSGMMEEEMRGRSSRRLAGVVGKVLEGDEEMVRLLEEAVGELGV